MSLQVLAEQCRTCIFRPGNPMKLRPGRVADMVRECEARQTYIPCHETMVYEDSDDEDDCQADGPICRGFYDQHGQVSQVVRMAERLGVVRFVPAPERSTIKGSARNRATDRPGANLGDLVDDQ